MSILSLRIELQAAYLDYFNHFLTVEGYADYYHITKEEAQAIIDAGRIIHNTITA